MTLKLLTNKSAHGDVRRGVGTGGIITMIGTNTNLAAAIGTTEQPAPRLTG
jgi:hypothetical protein